MLYILFEHASGYALFLSTQSEEIGAQLQEVQQAILNLSSFLQLVKLEGFSPFKSGANALENMNCISEGLIHDDLRTFLELNLSKEADLTLGVADNKLGATIQESLGFKCSTMGAIPDLIRGVRLHFHQLVEGLSKTAQDQAQLGLGHSYSRAKVKFNVNRVDNMIIQAISLLDQLDKDINTFSMRIREWYSYHFPELYRIVPDNYLYARIASFIRSRNDLSEEKLEGLVAILSDPEKAQAILAASKSSIGMDISEIDLLNIEIFATRVVSLAEYREQLHQYLQTKMEMIAPNLAALVGEVVGARLISHAGSLTNLAKYPASTVQILGAEKALFRALKTKGNTPKYGLIFNSSFIGKAPKQHKGKISRFLANKCSLASRIDCFAEHSTKVFGEKMCRQVEERLEFYETGVATRTNEEVMKEAVEEYNESVTSMKLRSKKKGKKKKKSQQQAFDDDEAGIEKMNGSEEIDITTPKKGLKKKKSQQKQSEESPQPKETDSQTPTKYKLRKQQKTLS